MPEMAARPLHLCLPLQKIPREARLLQEARLYWDFLLRHEARFARNPRMAMPYKAWAKMDAGERAATLAQAAHWLARLDEL